jgi:hypothetical protein
MEIGVVIRDPWYEFGTNTRYPGQPNYEALDRMGQELAATGARWVRLEFIVQQGAGSFDEQIARNDYFIDEVAPRYGLKVLGLLAFRLVDIDPRDTRNGLAADLIPGDSPYGYGVNQYMQDWLARALTILKRYEGRVAAYEVFNEPNRMAVVPKKYAGGEGINPERLAALHTKLYRCFKQNGCAQQSTDPTWREGVKLLVGGLHPKGSDRLVGPDAAAMSDRAYMTGLFSSAAFRSYLATYGAIPADGIGYHPYPAEIEATLAAVSDEVGRIEGRLDAIRVQLSTTLQSINPQIDVTAPALRFWITEVGYNAAYPGQNITGQTLFLRATFTALAARSDVAAAFWFKYEDFPPAGGANAQRWGLVHIPFSEDQRCPGGACYLVTGEPELRRPAFWVLRELAGLPVTRVLLPVVVK